MTYKNITGNTYVFSTKDVLIPFYKLNDKDIVLLDSGSYSDFEALDAFLIKHDFYPKLIINSHLHFDHVGCNAILKQKYKTKIAMPILESQFMTSTDHLKIYYSHITSKALTAYVNRLKFDTDYPIEESQKTFEFEGHVFGIVNLNGHSPSHIGISTPDNVLYVGDSLISEKLIMDMKLPSCYDIKRDLASKERLKTLDYDHYVLAHHSVEKDITALCDLNIEYFHNKVMYLRSIINDPITFASILESTIEAFKIRDISLKKYTYLEYTIMHYLTYLLSEDYIEKIMIGHQCYYQKKRT